MVRGVQYASMIIEEVRASFEIEDTRVVRAIAEAPGSTADLELIELSLRYGPSPSEEAIAKSLERLTKHGYVRLRPNGEYELTGAGRRAAA